jgi:polar amino acid transport system substrate-binding protein
MMKKLLSFFLLAVVAVVLAACGSSEDSSSGKEKLVIGIDDKFAPMGFRDEDNKIVGFDIDYARAAAEEMGYEVEFQPIDWSTKESELNSGRIDLIWNGYTITDERKEKVLFTKPYLENEQVIVTLKDSKIDAIADLEGKKVGVQKLSSALDALNADPIIEKIDGVPTEYSDNVLVLTDLKAGRTDVVVMDKVVAEYYNTLEEGVFTIVEEALAPEQYGVGVKKGNEALLEELQKALDTLTENGKAAEISTKWFGENIVLN